MKRHLIRFLLAVYVAGFLCGLLYVAAFNYFVRGFGDIEKFSTAIESSGLGWMVPIAIVAFAVVYTWAMRHRRLKWAE